MQEATAETVFKPSIAERMQQTDAMYRQIVSSELTRRQEKTRRLKLARASMADCEK
jgi:hypothetical protein